MAMRSSRLQSSHLRFSLRLFLLLALCGGNGWTQSLVIQRVTVIDATGRNPAPDMTVIVTGARIVTITSSKKTHLPKDSVIVDGAGKFLIPGLWDMHVHGTSDSRAPWSHLLSSTESSAFATCLDRRTLTRGAQRRRPMKAHRPPSISVVLSSMARIQRGLTPSSSPQQPKAAK